jgi:hypothetical protein
MSMQSRVVLDFQYRRVERLSQLEYQGPVS